MTKKKALVFPPQHEKRRLRPLAKNAILPRQDLTFRIIAETTIHGGSLHQSLLNGSLLRDANFDNVDFSRCDFESVKFERCKFTKCNFETAQFRASDIDKSEFIDCSFSGATIVDVRFKDSSLVNCSLQSTFSRDCKFSATRLENCLFAKSNTILNTYTQCIFLKTILGNCTFLLHIFDNCTFKDCAINADSIGQVYGIPLLQLKKFDMIFLGEVQNISNNGKLLEDIITQYRRRNWVLPLAFLSINFRLEKISYILQEVLKYISMQIKSMWPIKRDEIIFLIHIMNIIMNKKQLPLHSLSEFLDGLLLLNKQKVGEINSDILKYIIRESIALIQSMLSAVPSYLIEPEPLDIDLKVKAKITLKKQPNRMISSTLTEIGEISGLPIESPSETIESSSGSYVEILWTTINTLLAFQLVLFCFEGILVRITRIRARIEILRKKNLPSLYKSEALSPEEPMQKILLDTIKKIMSEKNALSSIIPDVEDVDAEDIIDITIED